MLPFLLICCRFGIKRVELVFTVNSGIENWFIIIIMIMIIIIYKYNTDNDNMFNAFRQATSLQLW